MYSYLGRSCKYSNSSWNGNSTVDWLWTANGTCKVSLAVEPTHGPKLPCLWASQISPLMEWWSHRNCHLEYLIIICLVFSAWTATSLIHLQWTIKFIYFCRRDVAICRCSVVNPPFEESTGAHSFLGRQPSSISCSVITSQIFHFFGGSLHAYIMFVSEHGAGPRKYQLLIVVTIPIHQ